MIRVIFTCFFLFSLTKILSQTVTITGDSVLCLGETTSLKATMTGSGYGTTNYVFEIIDFSTHPPFAGGEQIDPQFTGCTSSGNDDCFAPPDNPAPPNGYEIGFTFCFFNLQYSRFWVGSNGWIGFTNPTGKSWTTYNATTIPNTTANVPKNCIFAPWQDWYPGAGTAGNNVYYYTSGTAPNRKLVVYWLECPLFGCQSNIEARGTFMIVLNEQSSVIENFIMRKPNCENSTEGATQGVHNADGTIAYTATDRNLNVWTAFNEGTRFNPSGINWYKDTYPGGTFIGYGENLAVTPVTTTKYYALVGTCDGSSAIDSMTVIVNPLSEPTFTSGPTTACQNDNKTYTTQTGGNHYTWGINGGTLVAGGDIDDNWITIKWTNFGLNSVSVNYRTPEGCEALMPTVLNVSVTPFDTPVITNSATEYCAETEITFSTQTGKSNYIWEYLTSGAILVSGGSSSDDTIVLKWTTAGLKTISVNYTDPGGCTGDPPTSKSVTIKPLPAYDGLTAKTICSGSQTSINLTSTPAGGSFSWNNPAPECSANIVACPAGAMAGNSINDVLALNNEIQGQVTYRVITTLNGCLGDTAVVTVLVNPVPLVSNTITSYEFCSGESTAVPLSSLPSDATFSWTASCTPPDIVTGFTTPNSGNSLNDPLTNITAIPGVVTYSVTPLLNECAGNQVSFQITINPEPVPTFLESSSLVCQGVQNLTYSTQPGMTNYVWNISPGGTIDGGAATGTVQVSWPTAGSPPDRWIEVSYTNGNGCTANAPTRLGVTVKPLPNIIITPGIQTICSGQQATIHFESTIPGTAGNTAFTWNLTAPASVSPNLLTGANDVDIIFFNSAFTPQDVTFSVTATSLACTSQTSGNLVTVNPRPSVGFPVTVPPNTQEICSGTAMDSVPLHSTMIIPGVTYEWNAAAFDPVNPTTAISGFSSPGSGDTIPGENIVSTQLTQGVIKYNVTATFTSNGVGCPGDTEVYSVFVNPAPSVSFLPIGDQTICSGSTSSRIDLFTNTPPTTFSWQIVEIDGVAGAVTNGTTDFIPPQVLTTTGSVQGHVKYGLTPIYQGGGSFSCSGGVTYFTIFVDPLPSPVVSGTNSLCELSTDITYQTMDIAGNSYSWIVTGATNVINGNTHEITVNWGPSTASPGTVAVVETIDATGCTDTSAVMSVILHKRPNPLLNGSSQVCTGNTGMIYTTDNGMGNYLWNITGGEITGGGNGFPSATVTWNGQGSQYIEVNYQNLHGCSALVATRLPVMVNALPNTIISEGPGPNCEGALHLYMVPDDPLCSYVWSVTPSSRGTITGIQNGSTISVNWLSQGPATLSVTGTNGTTLCQSSNLHLLEINPKPMPTFSACFDQITTPNARKIILRGANPYLPGQGVFSGNRVILNAMTGNFEFDPTGASAGSYPVNYTFTNNFGCSNTTTPVTISIQNSSFSCGGDLLDVRDGKVYKTATFAGKCWMAQNLDYGISVSSQPALPQTDNCIAEKYCAPADASCTLFGGLYQWDEIMDYSGSSGTKGLCPPGWHLPTSAEWQQFIDNLIAGIPAPQANASVAAELKDPFLPSGFKALMSGVNYLGYSWSFTSGSFTSTIFWTATPFGNFQAVGRGMNVYNPSISTYNASRANAFPVRCIKD